MPVYSPFDYGQAVGQGTQNALAQMNFMEQADPNSRLNQLVQEQLQGTKQQNLLAQRKQELEEQKYTTEQQAANTKWLYDATTRVLQNPELLPVLTRAAQSKGLISPDADPSTITLDMIKQRNDELKMIITQDPETFGQPVATSTGELVQFGKTGAARATGYKAPAKESTTEKAKPPAGYRFTPDGNLEPIPGGPALKSPMSTALQKELIESDETVQSGKNAISMLDEALGINKKAYSGYGAKTRAVIASNLPGTSPDADATIDLDNIMTGQALESLKLIFGGMPTEGERKILLEMQASVDKTPAQRESIIKRAKAAAERRIAFSREKASSIRSGGYLTEGIQNNQPSSAGGGTRPKTPPKVGRFVVEEIE